MLIITLCLAETAVLLGLFAADLQTRVFERLVRILHVPVERRPRMVQELRRKTFHLQGFVSIPIMDAVSPNFLHNASIVLVIIAFAILGIERLRLHWPWLKETYWKLFGVFLRSSEYEQISGTFPLLLGLGVSLYFTDKQTAKFCYLVLFMGDAAASLFGIALGHHKIIGKKSVAGSLACVVACAIASKYCFAEPAVVNIVTGVLCGICELLCGTVILLDDNFCLPVMAIGVRYCVVKLFE